MSSGPAPILPSELFEHGLDPRLLPVLLEPRARVQIQGGLEAMELVHRGRAWFRLLQLCPYCRLFRSPSALSPCRCARAHAPLLREGRRR